MNYLLLNVDKTDEIVTDFRKKGTTLLSVDPGLLGGGGVLL